MSPFLRDSRPRVTGLGDAMPEARGYNTDPPRTVPVCVCGAELQPDARNPACWRCSVVARSIEHPLVGDVTHLAQYGLALPHPTRAQRARPVIACSDVDAAAARNRELLGSHPPTDHRAALTIIPRQPATHVAPDRLERAWPTNRATNKAEIGQSDHARRRAPDATGRAPRRAAPRPASVEMTSALLAVLTGTTTPTAAARTHGVNVASLERRLSMIRSGERPDPRLEPPPTRGLGITPVPPGRPREPGRRRRSTVEREQAVIDVLNATLTVDQASRRYGVDRRQLYKVALRIAHHDLPDPRITLDQTVTDGAS